MVPDPLPKYTYKIVPSSPPEVLPAEYPVSELDQKDGFIHMSTAAQGRIISTFPERLILMPHRSLLLRTYSSVKYLFYGS